MNIKKKYFVRRYLCTLLLWSYPIGTCLSIWIEDGFMGALVFAEIVAVPMISIEIFILRSRIKKMDLIYLDALNNAKDVMGAGLKNVVNNQQENLAKDIVNILGRKKETGKELHYLFGCRCTLCDTLKAISVSTFNQSYVAEMKLNILNGSHLYVRCELCSSDTSHTVNNFAIMEKAQ